VVHMSSLHSEIDRLGGRSYSLEVNAHTFGLIQERIKGSYSGSRMKSNLLKPSDLVLS